MPGLKTTVRSALRSAFGPLGPQEYPELLPVRSSDALWAFAADLRLAATQHAQAMADRIRRQVLLFAGLAVLAALVTAPLGTLGHSWPWVGALPFTALAAGLACALVGLVRMSANQRRVQALVGLDALGGPGRVPVRVWQALPWALGPQSPDEEVPEAFPAWPDFVAFANSSKDAVIAAHAVGAYLQRTLDQREQETFAVLLEGFDAHAERNARIDDLVRLSRLV